MLRGSSGSSVQGPWGCCGDAGTILGGPGGILGASPGGPGVLLWGPLERWEAFWEIIGVVPEPRFPFF